jgi:hypothetical protein
MYCFKRVEVVLRVVVQQLLGLLRPRSLVLVDDVGEVSGQLHGFGETGVNVMITISGNFYQFSAK